MIQRVEQIRQRPLSVAHRHVATLGDHKLGALVLDLNRRPPQLAPLTTNRARTLPNHARDVRHALVNLGHRVNLLIGRDKRYGHTRINPVVIDVLGLAKVLDEALHRTALLPLRLVVAKALRQAHQSAYAGPQDLVTNFQAFSTGNK